MCNQCTLYVCVLLYIQTHDKGVLDTTLCDKLYFMFVSYIQTHDKGVLDTTLFDRDIRYWLK
jgi:hypothetical protein